MDNAAQAISDFIWSTREGEVPVELIEKKLKLARYEVVSLLQELATAGHGTFVPGRRSRPSRIVKAANRPVPPPAPGLVSLTPSTSDSSKSQPESENPDAGVQVFVLKRDKPFRFVVPDDITKAEADKIAKWLDLVAEG